MARQVGGRYVQSERISEYFDKEKLDQIVRRGELLAILDQFAKNFMTPWYKRWWRWLQRYYVRSATAPIEPESEEKKK